MSQSWPVVALGEVIKHRKEFIEISDSEQYKRCRVQLHAKGIVLRDVVSGADIRTKRQQVCRTGEFLVAEIDAKLGGFGIVPEALEDAIVSSHYFLFTVNEAKLERSFLDYYIRTAAFQDQVTAQGSTNYAAIRPQHVLEYTIPLPRLDEQRRIVARIEALAGRVAEAQRLRAEAMTEVEVVLTSAKDQLFNPESLQQYTSVTLGEIADIRAGVTLGRRDITGPTIHLPYLRVANVQDGYLDLEDIKDVEIKEVEYDKWQLEAGDILLTEGGDWDKLGRGTVWQNEIPTCIHQNHIFRLRVNQIRFDPHYLMAMISSPYGKSYFQNSSKQTTNLASINQRQLKAFVVFEPPLSEQQRVVSYLNQIQDKVKVLRDLQAATQTELDALLPAILDKAFQGEL